MALKADILADLIKGKLLEKHPKYAPRYYTTNAARMFAMPGGRQQPLNLLAPSEGLEQSQWYMSEWFAKVIAEAVAEGVTEHLKTSLNVRTSGAGTGVAVHIGVAAGEKGDIS